MAGAHDDALGGRLEGQRQRDGENEELTTLGALEVGGGRLDVAQAHIPAALEADPENMDAEGTAACIALASGSTDAAMKHFAGAMASGHDPDPGPEVARRDDYRDQLGAPMVTPMRQPASRSSRTVASAMSGVASALPPGRIRSPVRSPACDETP
ncbi:MAG: hypothetical protein IPF99_18385 [Deltaproteobacteria bacterium]|nr:hypothetical protein [Deltaproteobacteria bacterium]MBP6829836.1 hypothetical protein [Deltaproteobacteria bacterium]